jgi:glycine oxidase
MRTGGEVVILGGGVIGLTTAYFLAREGVRVRVLDRGPVGREASWAGAGIVPPSDPTTARDPCDRLRALSGRLFPDLSAELRERSGIDNEYVRCGGIEFVLLEASMPRHEWAGEGIQSTTLNEADLTEIEPALQWHQWESWSARRPVLLPTLAQLRNPRHMQALREACARSGKVHFDESVEECQFVHTGERVRGVKSPAGLVEADCFLITAGAWTDQLLTPFGIRLGVRPIRGQIVLLNPGAMLFRRVLLYGARYLVPRLDGRVLVGSTEEDAGFVKANTAEGVWHLLYMATQLVPALAQAKLEQCWSGLRPGSPDGLPFIGRVPGLANLYVAAGHFRAGIQLSPGTALLVKELLLGQPLTLSLEAFRLERVARDD